MKREIKFRAIDKATKAWVYGVPCESRDGLCIVSYIHHIDGAEYNVSESVIIPETVGQLTGLKDKNGKEIYEGDVVKRFVTDFDTINAKCKEALSQEDWDNAYATTPDVPQISIIEYDGHGFWVKNESFGYEGEDLWDWEKMEVIGNIYENPELIA